MRFYALAQRPWVDDGEGGGWWGRPPGILGSVDLSAAGRHDRVFVTSGTPFDPANVLASFGDGVRLDAYVLTARESNSWETLTGVIPQPGWTLLDALWSTLTVNADPDGLVRAKPIMPTSKGVLELHLGGHSLVRSERLPDDPTTHPAWPNIQAVKQRTYRKIRARDPIFARKWLGNEQSRFRLSPERARDLIIPSDLPRELPLRPTTTIGDTFTDTSGTLLANHTATGPNGGFSWVAVSAGTSTNINASGEVDLQNGDGKFRADSALSSDDHYAQGEMRYTGGNQVRGVAVRFAAAADTCYMAAFYANADQILLYKIEAGTATQLEDAASTYAQGDIVKLEVSGSTLTVSVNGTPVIDSFSDTSIEAGLYTGFNESAGSGSDAEIDNFEAEDLAAEVGEDLVRAVAEALGLSAARRHLLTLARITAEPEGMAETNLRLRALARLAAHAVGLVETGLFARGLTRLRAWPVGIAETTVSVLETLGDAIIRIVAEAVAIAEAIARARRVTRIRTDLVGIGGAVARIGGVVSATVPAITDRARMVVGAVRRMIAKAASRFNVPPARR